MKKSNKWLMLALAGLLVGACGGQDDPKDKPADDKNQEQKKDDGASESKKDDGQSEEACPEGFIGANCDQCADNHYGLKCKECTCLHGECNDTIQGDGFCREESCEPGWVGRNCNQCAENFTGDNCDQCKNELHSGENCDECTDKRFTGEYCDECKPAAHGYIIDDECNSYKTVVINNKTWLATNIAYKGSGVTCRAPGDDENNIATYGCLYSWEDAQKVCPAGWRLPTKEDFEYFVEIARNDSSSLRDTSWENGSNSTGFSALPAGYGALSDNGNPNGSASFGESAKFWSATEGAGTGRYSLSISEYGVSSNADFHYNYGFSVRCVKK